MSKNSTSQKVMNDANSGAVIILAAIHIVAKEKDHPPISIAEE